MRRLRYFSRIVLCAATLSATVACDAVRAADPTAGFTILFDRGHPWRPPFSLQRVGSPTMARVERAAKTVPAAGLCLSARVSGQESTCTPVEFAPDQVRSQRIALAENVDEVVLLRRTPGQPDAEITRARLARPDLEADATAAADRLVNPVDLGAILPPTGWLLLGPDQTATIDVALLSRTSEPRPVEITAWFAEAPDRKLSQKATIEPGNRFQTSLKGLSPPIGCDRTTLQVTVVDASGTALWKKEIPAMLAIHPPKWPSFGATAALLRYDAPISVRDPATGKFSEISYDKAWQPDLRDVVVSFPSGARFVFWRGSSYIPFWAGLHNTGLCYEWAEHGPPMPPNAVDCVEPLMDKELRYGRVEIVQSTPARVHVRWSYQSTDFEYKVWGDAAVEDYYFYPDGFGTRVLTLKHEPKAEYELSELILLTAANTYPLSVVPLHTVDAIFLDGRKHEFLFPAPQPNNFQATDPVVYRIRLHSDEPMSAIYFNSRNAGPPFHVFGHFYDDGELVTPAYWGSHWPLARGNATGWKIDERVSLTPCHNSLMSWAQRRPHPLSTGLVPTLDALGRSQEMVIDQWAWLIGLTNADDAALVRCARSFAQPPGLTVSGATLELDSYVLQRRALRLQIQQPQVKISLEPSSACVHPVFELRDAPAALSRVTLDGQPLAAQQYAWDGHVLWLGVEIDKPATLELQFGTGQ